MSEPVLADEHRERPCDASGLHECRHPGRRRSDLHLHVTPQAERALWSAVWALEDSLRALRRLRTLESRPPYVDSALERTEQEVRLLRDLLVRSGETTSDGPPGPEEG